jgi:thiamine-phosphate pyrophosphorylase
VNLRKRLADARLYLCTDGRRGRGDLPEFLDAVLAAGVDIVQLREKGLEAREELALLEVFREACDRHGALLAVNDRADVARAARPDILHLGQDDLPVPVAREILGPDILIGRSTHSAEEATAAASEPGVDYFCCGPTWPTPTKPGRPAPGVALLDHASRLDTDRPWTPCRSDLRRPGMRPIGSAQTPVLAVAGFSGWELRTRAGRAGVASSRQAGAGRPARGRRTRPSAGSR